MSYAEEPGQGPPPVEASASRSPRSVAVFCGSNPGFRPAYREAAAALGTCLASRGLRLVYGGASVGTMGALADSALAAGGEVTGVIPRALVDLEIAHRGVTELLVVESMHERKAAMARCADAFIALPGGLGTLEEFFEVWTWNQLGILRMPLGLLEVEDFFAPLLSFLASVEREGFLRSEHRRMVLHASCPEALLDHLFTVRSTSIAKWVDPVAPPVQQG